MVRRVPPVAVQRFPHRFTNTSDTNADPVIAPNGRFVAFVSRENLDPDRHPEDTLATVGEGTPDIFRQPFDGGPLVRVSTDEGDRIPTAVDDQGNTLGAADFYSPATSFRGGLVAFTTNGALVDELPSDERAADNRSGDVYLKNVRTGEVTLVSVEADGGTAAGGVPLGTAGGGALSSPPVVAMSADGRYVAFLTTAPLDPAHDHNTKLDVYVRDLQAQVPEDRYTLVSVDAQGNAAGVPGDTTIFRPSVDFVGSASGEFAPSVSMSFNGRYVAFATDAPLIPEDQNNHVDIYVRDLVHDKTILASRVEASGGGKDPVPPAPLGFPRTEPDPTVLDFVRGPGLSSDAVIAGKGRFVAFESSAALVADDTNGLRDIYVRDLVTGTTVRVSVDAEGRETATHGSFNPSISADGRFVAFQSAAGDLVLDDTNLNRDDSGPTRDVFVKDLWTGAVSRVSLDANDFEGNGDSFAPSISADGSRIAYLSDAPNILNSPERAPDARDPGDSLVISEVSFAEPEVRDIPDNTGGAADLRTIPPITVPTGSPPEPEETLDFALRSTIDGPHDRDWFRVQLDPSVFSDELSTSVPATYRIDLEGQATGQGTLSDPLVRLFDANGNEVAADDDGGVGFNAVLFFRPPADGTYFISAESFGEATGTYRLVMRVNNAAPPPEGRSLLLADLLDHDPGIGAHGHAPARAAAGPDAGSADAAPLVGAAPLGEALNNLLGGASEHVI